MKCPKCGGEHIATRPNAKNPSATDLFCTDCGAWIKFANADDRRLYPAEEPTCKCGGHCHGLTANEYQKAAMRTASGMNYDHYGMLINGALGLCGESGEVADIIKKATFQGHEIDTEHIAEELGDVAWYITISAEAIGYSLEDILQKNIDKLMKRYPEGFDPERSVHRPEYEEVNHENH